MPEGAGSLALAQHRPPKQLPGFPEPGCHAALRPCSRHPSATLMMSAALPYTHAQALHAHGRAPCIMHWGPCNWLHSSYVWLPAGTASSTHAPLRGSTACQGSRCSQIDLRTLGRAAAQAREASARCGGVISPSLQQLYAALGRAPQPNAREEAEALVASVAAGESVQVGFRWGLESVHLGGGSRESAGRGCG